MTEKGFERLLCAIRDGDSSAALDLLSKRPKLTRAWKARAVPALDDAAFRGWHDVCEVLIACGVSPTIHACSALGDFGGGKRILRTEPELAGVKDSVRSFTPMFFAAAQDKKEMIDLLIEFEAKVDAEDSLGNTALHVAAAAPALRAADRLIGYGAAINARNFARQTPLHWALEEWWSEGSEMLKLLLRNGADVNAQDENKVTPLAKAIASNKTHLIDILRGKKGREL